MIAEGHRRAALIRHYRHQFPDDAFCTASVFWFSLFRCGWPRFQPPIPKAYDVRRLRRYFEQAADVAEQRRAEGLRMVSILAKMPVLLQAVLLLRSWDKLTYLQIQGCTGIPHFMVERLLIRARLLLVYYDMDLSPGRTVP